MDEPPVPPAVEVEDDEPLPDEPAVAATAADASTVPELGVEREALAFVAGYVAYKCRHIRDLGQPSSTAPASSTVPSRWLRTISRGNLHVPSDWWMAIVEDFNGTFCDVMGCTADRAPDIQGRLVTCVLAKVPELDRRIARKLVSTRLHLRLRWLNACRAASQAARYSARKTSQHAKGSKS